MVFISSKILLISSKSCNEDEQENGKKKKKTWQCNESIRMASHLCFSLMHICHSLHFPYSFTSYLQKPQYTKPNKQTKLLYKHTSRTNFNFKKQAMIRPATTTKCHFFISFFIIYKFQKKNKQRKMSKMEPFHDH